MPSKNRIILASAGSGKTTDIVSEAVSDVAVKSALVTYTNNSVSELKSKAYELYGCVPQNLRTYTWYRFLLQHLVRPYQRSVYDGKVRGFAFVTGQSARYIPESDVNRHYFRIKGEIYIDKVSKFACKMMESASGASIARLEQIVDRVYIDEAQDLSGYDLDLLEYLLNSDLEVILVGDHRQATYRTNQSSKNRRFAGQAIVHKFEEWAQKGLVQILIQNHSHRCVQSICDVADRLFPKFPRTKSLNTNRTGHDGVFLVPERSLESYIGRYSPQPLRYNRSRRNIPGSPYNFGESKGMTFDRVLIYPHRPLLKYCATGTLSDAGKELSKIYVAITRARQSVGIVVPNNTDSGIVPLFEM